MQFGPRIGARGAIHQQCSRHPEPDQQPASVEFDENLLAIAADVLDPAANKIRHTGSPDTPAGVGGLKNSLALNARRERADDGFGFRKLRHGYSASGTLTKMTSSRTSTGNV